MPSAPKTNTLMSQDLYKSQFENLGHIKRNLILSLRLRNGQIMQPKKPNRKPEVKYPK